MRCEQIGKEREYSAPAIEFLDIETEKGFAQTGTPNSPDIGGTNDNGAY